MMFLRHGIFARRGRLERRRNLAIASVAGLLLMSVVAIYGLVNAAQSADLGGADGLTQGDITGEFLTNTGGNPVDIARDDQVLLRLTFDIGSDKMRAARDADTWVYDLSDLFAASDVFDSMVADGGTVYYGSQPMGTYSVNGSSIVMSIDPAFLADKTSATAGVTVTLNLAPEKVKTKLTSTTELPGSIDPNNNDQPYTATLSYETPAVDINDYVHDDQSNSWKEDNAGNVAIEKDANDRYIASYNTGFTTNAYIDDLTLTINLSDNQSFTGDIQIAYCNYTHCATSDTQSKVTIPSQFITYTNSNEASINMAGFLNYCKTNGACEDGSGNKIIDGYQIITGSNTNRYELIYDALLLDGGDATADPQTYTGITTVQGHGENSTVITDTDSVSFTSVSDPIDATKSGTLTTVGGVTTIDYSITIGEAGDHLSGETIVDRISDDQLLTGDITITSQNGAGTSVTISNTCANAGDSNCINPDALDNTFSTSEIQLFNYTFPSGSSDGPYVITYTVTLPNYELGKNVTVSNKVDLVINNTTYSDIARWDTKHDFVEPQTYIAKKVTSVNNDQGIVEWLVTVYGPDEPTEIFDDITVKDYTWQDNEIETVYVSHSIDGQVPSGEPANGVSYDSNTKIVTIDHLYYGQTVYIVYRTAADQNYIEAHAGEGVKINNFVEEHVDNRTEIASAEAMILQPSPEVVNKSVEKTQTRYYYENNGAYSIGDRDGYKWTVEINKGSKGAVDADYEPYFTDTIPSGLYLAFGDPYNDPDHTAVLPTYSQGVAQDISQANYTTYVDIERKVNGNWVDGQTNQRLMTPVSVTVNPDGSVTINPINLAALFNDSSCDVTNQIAPSDTCAGINNTEYKISYRTTLSDEIYYKITGGTVLSNYAELQKKVGNDYSTQAFKSAQTTYKNGTVIQKEDVTADSLSGTNNLIEYNVRVNTTGGMMNNGNPVEFADTIAGNMNFYPYKFFTTGANADDPNNAPIVCMDGDSNTIRSDCDFSYDSETATITGTVPDNAYITIKFHTIVVNPIPNTSQSFTNTATIKNDSGFVFDSTATKNHTASAGSAWVDADGTVSFRKIDSSDMNQTIGGVEFGITELGYDATTGLLDGTSTSVNTYTTSLANGTVTADNLQSTIVESGSTTNGALYYWEELTAPSPYIPESTVDKHYFMLYDVESDTSKTQANREAATIMATLIQNNQDNASVLNGAEITVIPDGYQWNVTNVAQDTTFLRIEKSVSGNRADPTKEFEVTLAATNSLGDPMNGTVQAYTYDLSDPDTTTATTVSFDENGEAVITLTHNQGIKVEGLFVGGSYEVEEEDYSSAYEGNYTTSYTCTDLGSESGCDQSGNEGTIMTDGQLVAITNTSSMTPTGVSTNKNIMPILFAVAGGCIVALGAVIAIKVRH